jgi:hypothetical protein
MKRKAILIESSNVSGETDLPGARVDQKNWENFLKSELGGAWEDYEITTLSKPYCSDVEKLLEENKDKYCFVAFSGHGCDGSVALNDIWKSCPLARIKPRGEKGTLIVDSCRGVEVAVQHNFSAKQVLIANADRGRSVVANARRGELTKFSSEASVILEKRYAHSAIWRLELLKSNNGIVQMLACAKGEGAGEDPRAGGYYTSLLLQSADLWEAEGCAGGVHTTLDAHRHASRKMPSQQNPEYSPASLAFPFAV